MGRGKTVTFAALRQRVTKCLNLDGCDLFDLYDSLRI